ncbi:MAG: ComEC/Rec2 family competence protein, partial [Hyphomicrobium sp.]
RYPIKKWAAVAGILGALGYLSISGGAFATVRSALMIVVIFGAVLLDRPALALRNVALSALVILLLYPESLFDAGFQMSFAAVTGLVATYEEVRRRMGRRNEPHPVLRVLLFFGGIVFSTLIASAAVAPFAAFHFHQSQQYAVLANLAAIPICNLIVMPAALAALVLMPLGLEALALIPMGLGIDAMSWCAAFVAKLPGAVGHIPAIPQQAFVLMVLGGLWLALWQSRQRLLGVALVIAGLAMAPFQARPDVLIARNGELVALRGPDGLLSALPARQSAYEVERWLEHDGDARKAAEVQKGAAFTCDSVGCVARVKGARVAVARHPAAIADDCAVARVVVLSEPRPEFCETTGMVIDFFDVWREGTHALYIEQADAQTEGPAATSAVPRIRVDTVAAHRGDRPWAPFIAKRDRQGPRRKPQLPTPRVAEAERAGAAEPGASEIGDEPSLPNFAGRPEWLVPSEPRAEFDDDEDFSAIPGSDP